MFFKKKKNTCIDLGSYEVKCAVMDQNSQKIDNFWNEKLDITQYSPTDSYYELEYKRIIPILLEKLQKEVEGFDPSNIFTSIQGNGNTGGYMEIPRGSQKEIELSLHNRLKKIMPFSLEEHLLNYFQVPPIDKLENKISVFFIVTPKSNIETIKKIFKNFGIDIKRMEASFISLAREFYQNHRLPNDKYYMIVNIGFKITHIIIVRGTVPYYVRELPLAGRDFTNAFLKGTQLTWEEAEKYKLNYNVLNRDLSAEAILTKWLDEVNRSLVYFIETYLYLSDARPEMIYLSGGGALFKGLDKRLSDYLEIDTIIDRWGELKAQNPEEAYKFKLCAGLGLG